jgi:Glycosyltransferase family 87
LDGHFEFSKTIERNGNAHMRLLDFVRRHKWTLLLMVVAALYYPRFVHHPQGAQFYAEGATALLHQIPLEVGRPTFTYPPIFAFVMIPFVFLPDWLRDLLWYLVLVGSAYFSFRLCEHLTLRAWPAVWPPKELMWLRVLTLLLSIKLVLAVFENQAYDAIVVVCALVGLYGLAAGKDLHAMAGLALAAALKVTPLLFFPYLLLRRRFRLCLLCVGFYAAVSLLPDVFFTPQGDSLGYYNRWAHDMVGGLFVKSPAFQTRQWDVVNPLNESLRSLVTHLTTGTSWSAHASRILLVVYSAYALAVLGLLIRSGKMKDPYVVDGCVLLISMLMLAPMSSKSHFIALMLPYMVLTAYAIREPHMRRVGGSVLAVSFALNSLTAKQIMGKHLSEIFLSSGCITLGTLILLVFFGHIIFNRGKSSGKPARTQP